MHVLSCLAIGFLSCLLVSCGNDPSKTGTTLDLPKALKAHSHGCGAVPKSFRKTPYKLDVFYQQYCDANGIPILASARVSVDALKAVERRADVMMQKLKPAVTEAMIASKTRIAIMAESELTTDIPEHSDLNEVFPEVDWNVRARGLGATRDRPTSSAAEENILCLPGDKYAGEDIFVHEFAHSIHKMGLNVADLEFETELGRAYDAAIKRGLWAGTYAGTNAEEYWAEGVQSWFDLNAKEQAGVHNYVNTRAELKQYDRGLHDLIAQFMPAVSLTVCST